MSVALFTVHVLGIAGTIGAVATLGYLISFRTYGTWLHGRAEGSVDSDHNVPGTPYLPADAAQEARAAKLLKCPPIVLDAQRRFVVDATVQGVCDYRRWTLHAVHVRTTHVHVVITARHTPERVMTDLKGWATRRMRESGVLGADVEPWAYHGSTRY